MGGSEATLTRVADALGAWVIQHNRTEDFGRYRRPQPLPGIASVIVNRDPCVLPLLRAQYPAAHVYLWLHDRIQPRSKRARTLAAAAALLGEMAVTAVCVSDWQRAGVEATLRGLGLAGRVRALTIYNPVDDALIPDGYAGGCAQAGVFLLAQQGARFHTRCLQRTSAADARSAPDRRQSGLQGAPRCAARRGRVPRGPAAGRVCTPRCAVPCARSLPTSSSRRPSGWCLPNRMRSARRCSRTTAVQRSKSSRTRSRYCRSAPAAASTRRPPAACPQPGGVRRRGSRRPPGCSMRIASASAPGARARGRTLHPIRAFA